MKGVIEESFCTGCGACAEICPKNAIRMIKNEDGFLHSEIVEDNCVKCGLCEQVCRNNSVINTIDIPQKYYVLKAIDKDVLISSSSGGAFTAISDIILMDGGTVYGCVFDQNGLPKHIRADNTETRDMMRGSKYIQSDMQSIYTQIMTDLKRGKKVLFTGTPCQVDAVKHYMAIKKVSTDYLFTMDIICHGVPSRDSWREYLTSLERRYHGQAKKISFRTKQEGDNGQILRILFDNGRRYVSPAGHDVFYRSFLENYSLCESCFKCNYCSFDRTADITVGDICLGRNDLKKVKQDYLRESTVIVNSKKGENLFSKINTGFIYEETNREYITQHSLVLPAVRPSSYREFKMQKRGLFWKLWGVSGRKDRILMLINFLGLSELFYKIKSKIRRG